jgi:hypothetical protein
VGVLIDDKAFVCLYMTVQSCGVMQAQQKQKTKIKKSHLVRNTVIMVVF